MNSKLVYAFHIISWIVINSGALCLTLAIASVGLVGCGENMEANNPNVQTEDPSAALSTSAIPDDPAAKK